MRLENGCENDEPITLLSVCLKITHKHKTKHTKKECLIARAHANTTESEWEINMSPGAK